MTVARPPQKAKPDQWNYLQVRVPGWLKNEVLAHCEDLNCSLNAWLVEVIRWGLREGQGLPHPPPAHAPLPTPSHQMRAYLLGERLMTPCGQQGECPATEGQVWDHDEMTFCRSCGIRVD